MVPFFYSFPYALRKTGTVGASVGGDGDGDGEDGERERENEESKGAYARADHTCL